MATSNLRFRIIGEDDASPAFAKVAAAAELASTAFGDMGTNALGLGKLIGAAGLIPIAVGAAGAVVELGTALGVAGAAAGVFGISAGFTFSQMVKQQQQMDATSKTLAGLVKGTTSYKTELTKLHMEQAQFNQQFGVAAKGWNDMKNAFTSFQNATKNVTTGVLGHAFELVAKVLPMLVPVAKAAGKAIDGLLVDLFKFTDGPGFQHFLDVLKNKGPKAITAFGHIIGNVVVGLAGILKNFVGPGMGAAHMLENLTAAFAKWGNSKGVSESVQKFLGYMSGNSGKIASVFQSLASILPKLAIAFGQLGSANLSAVSMFLNLLASFNQGTFDVIVKGLFAIAAGSKAVNIAIAAGTAIRAAALALTALEDACIGTRIALIALAVSERVVAVATKIYTAAQWLLNAALAANPIGIVIVALAALAAGLVYAYTHSQTFRNIVNAAFHGVAVAAQAVFGWIVGHWKLLFAVLGGPIGLATVLIVNNFGKIEAAIRVAGSWARWLWSNAFAPALKFIVTGLSVLLNMWGHMLTALGHVPGFGWATTAGKALEDAANKAQALANSINNIPSSKTVNIDIFTRHMNGTTYGTGGHVPTGPSGNRPGGRNMVGNGRGAGGDTYITVNAPSGMIGTPDSVAQQIHTALLKRKRQHLGGAGMGFD